MANEAYVEVKPNTAYQNLATLAQISLSQGSTYTIQVTGDVMIIEADSTPTEGGFHINFPIPFQYTAGTGNLYVKNLREYESAFINIAE